MNNDSINSSKDLSYNLKACSTPPFTLFKRLLNHCNIDLDLQHYWEVIVYERLKDATANTIDKKLQQIVSDLHEILVDEVLTLPEDDVIKRFAIMTAQEKLSGLIEDLKGLSVAVGKLGEY